MTEQLVIGVGGLLTAGKDAFADHLVDQHGFKKLGMSDTLAEALKRLDPWVPLQDINDGRVATLGTTEWWKYSKLLERFGYVELKNNPEVRRLLQKLGTEVGRQLFGENFWVNIMIRNVLDALAGGAAGVVFTGVRYPNELQIISRLQHDDIFATSVWVRRPGLVAQGHTSETSVSEEAFEYVLDNDGSLQELDQKSDELISRIRKDFSAWEDGAVQ